MGRATDLRVELFGGGPADGERRTATEGQTTIVVDLVDGDDHLSGDGPTAHLYDRQPDGRFRYAGVGAPPPTLPEPTHADDRDLLLSALGHDRGPHPAAILLMLVIVVGATYAFTLYA